MKILFVGDVVGKPGRIAFARNLPKLKSEKGPFSAIIVNGENAAGGRGITRKIANDFFRLGVDVITTGNHIWSNKEIFDFIDEMPDLIRPANFPKITPGSGFTTIRVGEAKLAVINLAGQIFMDYGFSCPFQCLDEILEEIGDRAKLIIVDFHAEATSEKMAIGWYADGRVSAVLGTHTHIQTADDRILPKGTAYITDVGMTGPYDSVIGTNLNDVIYRFTTMIPIRYTVAKNNPKLCGVVIELDRETGKAKSIERIQIDDI